MDPLKAFNINFPLEKNLFVFLSMREGMSSKLDIGFSESSHKCSPTLLKNLLSSILMA